MRISTVKQKIERLDRDVANELYMVRQLFEHRHDFGVMDTIKRRKRLFESSRFFVRQSISTYRELLHKRELLLKQQ